MITTINGKKYMVGILKYRYHNCTNMGIFPYHLDHIEKFYDNYYKAIYKHKDGDTISQIVTLF